MAAPNTSEPKVELVDPNVSKEIPTTDINAPLKAQNLDSNPVPTTDVNAPINIEKVTQATDIPESNLNAPLKIDNQKTPATDYDKHNRKLMLIGVLIVVVVILGIGSFIFLRRNLGL